MKERLPPLQGMYYFYIAAEKGSFKSASEHLFVTAAAISQQIRQLEEWLECELFERQHRKVKLTIEGEILYQSAKKGFFELQDGVRKLNQDPEPDRLSISTHPTFAQHWLIPRLKTFREQNPQLSLLVDPKNELVNFQDGLIDICVRYGHGEYPELEAVKLMDETLYPVCHPAYQKEKGLWNTEDLEKAELIEDVWPDMTWSLWFEELNQKESKASIKYDGSQFVMEGALSAQGVALVKHSLAYRYLKEGQLVRVGNKAAKSRYSYFLCAPAGYFRRDKIRAFRNWIESEVNAFQTMNRDTSYLINISDNWK